MPDEWKQFLLRKKILGYDDILHCLQEQSVAACSKDVKLIDTIAQKTRHYAKRQETFWRSFKKDLTVEAGASCLQEVNLTHMSVEVYLDHIAQLLKKESYV